jgi:hypothetical protein
MFIVSVVLIAMQSTGCSSGSATFGPCSADQIVIKPVLRRQEARVTAGYFSSSTDSQCTANIRFKAYVTAEPAAGLILPGIGVYPTPVLAEILEASGKPNYVAITSPIDSWCTALTEGKTLVFHADVLGGREASSAAMTCPVVLTG